MQTSRFLLIDYGLFLNHRVIVFFICILSISSLRAQEGFITTGGNNTGSGGSVSFSTGLVAYTTNYGTDVQMIQGIQQPYEISVISTTERPIQKTALFISAFPNPTSDFLTLKIENHYNSFTFFQLFDYNGKLLKSKTSTKNETIVNMSNYPSAVYFLKVYFMDSGKTSFHESNEANSGEFINVGTKQYNAIKIFKIVKQ